MQLLMVAALAFSLLLVVPSSTEASTDHCEAGYQRVQPVIPAGVDASLLTVCANATGFWVRNDDPYSIWLVTGGISWESYTPPKQVLFRKAMAELGVSGYPVFPFQRNRFLSPGLPTIALAPVEVHAAWREWDLTEAGEPDISKENLSKVRKMLKVIYDDLKEDPPTDIWPPKAGRWPAAVEWLCQHLPRVPC